MNGPSKVGISIMLNFLFSMLKWSNNWLEIVYRGWYVDKSVYKVHILEFSKKDGLSFHCS